jgi:hypothetical protein
VANVKAAFVAAKGWLGRKADAAIATTTTAAAAVVRSGRAAWLTVKILAVGAFYAATRRSCCGEPPALLLGGAVALAAATTVAAALYAPWWLAIGQFALGTLFVPLGLDLALTAARAVKTTWRLAWAATAPTEGADVL